MFFICIKNIQNATLLESHVVTEKIGASEEYMVPKIHESVSREKMDGSLSRFQISQRMQMSEWN